MKIINNMGKSMILVIFIVLFAQNVFSLGVTPAWKSVDFKPGLEGDVNLEIINSGHTNFKTVLYVDGDGANYIFLENSELTFSANEESKIIKYHYKLPQKFNKPGINKINLVIREIPINSANEGTVVGASVAIIHELRVKVPYPGKYAIAELKVAETNVDNQVNFIVPVSNLGTQKIINAKGIIDIYGPTNEKITTIETNLASIDPGMKVDLSSVWKQEKINPGKYYAKLTLTYDGAVTNAEKIFNFGNLLLDIIDINVKDFKLGDIAKFNILVENSWADIVKNVYVELIISEDGGLEVGRFKSASEDIMALSKEELTSFWDTAGVEEGEYGAKAILYYGNETVEKDMKAFISLNSIRFDLFGTGAVTAGSGEIDKNGVIVIALVILILINVGWFVYFKRRKK